MKYARDLKKVESQAPQVFKGSFINYEGLKKFLKYRARQLNQIPEQSAAYVDAVRRSDTEFLRMLAGQLKEVDRRFELEARGVIAAFDAKKTKRRSFFLHRDPAQSRLDPEVALDLAERAGWCQKYAQTNAQAMRKIAKKHDKVFKVKTGQQFVQACWRGDIAVKNFLSAPMLSELAAVEALLRSKANTNGASLDPASSTDGCSNSDLDTTAGFKCAICLDVMYLPVALECGHKFCARCAIATALGHEGTVGGVENLLASGPVGCSSAPCPQCRATEHGTSGRGVFFNAERLPHLDELIKSRYPEDWQRRREEDNLEQGELKAARTPHGLFSFFHRNSLTRSGEQERSLHPGQASSHASSQPSQNHR